MFLELEVQLFERGSKKQGIACIRIAIILREALIIAELHILHIHKKC